MTSEHRDHDETAERLRRAIDAHTAGVEPDPDSFRHIEEELMSDRRFTRRHGLILGGLAAAAVLVVAVLVLAGDGDDEGEVLTDTTDTTAPTTTSSSTTTSSTSSTTSTTAFAPTADPRVPIFPAVDSSRRFDDPAAAAAAFATDFVGFTDPVVGDFLQGDDRSGEVEVQPEEGGPTTVVFLRMLDDETWGVIGAGTDDIRPEEPGVDEVITSPVTVRGEALAFEGTVNVDIREQGAVDSLGDGFVTGSGVPPAGPYEGEIGFAEPSADTGAVLYRVFSARDGEVSYAAATRVQFTDPE